MGRKQQGKQEQPEGEEQLDASSEATGLLEDDADVVELFPETSADGDPTAERIQALEQELADWKDRCLRQAADMENLRHRTRREADDARRFANERLVTELLPVVDNFGRALEAAEQTDNPEALKSGVEQIHRLMSDILARAGLTRIQALGEPFDPNQHEAILQVPPTEDQEPGFVVEELRPGYRLNDRVVRPSLVKVTS
jgi:molecular chaperone GrpE